MTNFYVTLPSNVSNGYSDLAMANKTSDFTTYFPQNIIFNGPYEVALSEIIYFQNWKFKLCDVIMREGLYEETHSIYVYDGNDNIKSVFEKVEKKLNIILETFEKNVTEFNRPYRYDPISDDFMKYDKPKNSIKDPFNTYMGNPMSLMSLGDYDFRITEQKKFSFIVENNTVQFKVPDSLFVQFIGTINTLWDITETKLELNQEDSKYIKKNSSIFNTQTNDYKLPLLYSRLNGVHSLFVYSDIIDNQFVGNSRSPLLNVVNVSNNYQQVISRIYDNPNYIPVSSREISSINISIRDDTGEKIFFTNSKVIIKLHFRSKRFF